MPISGEKLGFTPYVPWIVFTSAGLIGAARARRRTEEDGRLGEMEWVCNLEREDSLARYKKKDITVPSAYLSTSLGSPNLVKTSDLACVYPYGPDLCRTWPSVVVAVTFDIEGRTRHFGRAATVRAACGRIFTIVANCGVYKFSGIISRQVASQYAQLGYRVLSWGGFGCGGG